MPTILCRNHGTAGPADGLRRLLATAQVALAFMLLIGAALLLASFRAVLAIDPGFEPTGVVRQGPRTSFKTALELARSFPIGVHGSQVCQYYYNTGYSSPGTRCSYCQGTKR